MIDNHDHRPRVPARRIERGPENQGWTVMQGIQAAIVGINKRFAGKLLRNGINLTRDVLTRKPTCWVPPDGAGISLASYRGLGSPAATASSFTWSARASRLVRLAISICPITSG